MYTEYKKKNPSKVLDDNSFFTVGEVYGYNIGGKKLYDFGDKKVDYFANGFNSLINFDFRNEAKMNYEELFSKYSNILQNDLKGFSVMNYVTSHDDGYPFDKKRERTFEAGTKLLLTPGISQVYYGDELARPLDIAGTQGDATLRSFMNWDELLYNKGAYKLLYHFQRKKFLSVLFLKTEPHLLTCTAEKLQLWLTEKSRSIQNTELFYWRENN